jgi:hypothetical protein
MTRKQRHLAGTLLISLCISTYAKAERCERQADRCEKPAEELQEIVRVSAGGPYRALVGKTVLLRGTYKIAGQTEDMQHLAAIGQALQAYLHDHGTYPPAALVNAWGQATVSWRVLILPYLGHKDLYDRFDLTRTWDSPANKYLLRSMPAIYRKAGCNEWQTETGYAGVTGANSLFEKASKQLNGGRPVTGIFQSLPTSVQRRQQRWAPLTVSRVPDTPSRHSYSWMDPFA